MDAADTVIGSVGLGNEISQGFTAGIGEGRAGIGCRSVVEFDRRVLFAFAFGARRQSVHCWMDLSSEFTQLGPSTGAKYCSKYDEARQRRVRKVVDFSQ
jgi:hypothetical protein